MITILFVHIGPTLPTHLLLNLERTDVLFPKSRIVLVTDAGSPMTDLPIGVKIIDPDELDWEKNRLEIRRDQRFWDGWWQKTFDRLLMIAPVHKLFPESSILHVESDSILFPSFPFDELRREGKIAFPMYSADKAVASVVFSPDVSRSEMFEKEILKELSSNPGTSDMDALGAIVPNLGREFIQLPEFPEELRETFPSPLAGSGFFDGLSHGEWLCGRDPKAHWGLGMRMRSTPNSEHLSFPLYELKDNQVFLNFRNSRRPLNNLHVHSKESIFFRVDGANGVQVILDKINNRKDGNLYFFSVHAFFFCLRSKLKIWTSSALSFEAWKRLASRLFSCNRNSLTGN